MNIKKLFLSLLCAGLALVATAREIGGINYNLDADENTAVVVRRDFGNYSGSITIPAKIQYQRKTYRVVGIGEGAFANSAITSVKIANGIIEIGAYAFTNCQDLTSVSLQNGLEMIGDEAFSYCSELREIAIPSTVKRLMYNAFNETPIYKNRNNWIDGVLYVDNCLMVAKSTVSGVFNVPAGTRIIADAAFCYVTNLSALIIPSSVFAIGAMSGIAYGLQEEQNANSRNMRFWTYYRYPFNATPDSIVIEAKYPPFIDDALATFPVNARIYVPAESMEDYQSSPWSIYNPRPIDVDKLRKYLNDDIKQICKGYNERLKKNPYYDGVSVINVEPMPDTQTDITKLHTTHDRTVRALEQFFNKLQKGGMVKKMQRNDPDRYIAIYRSLHPKVSQKIDETLVEYRCQPELTRKICLRIIAKKPLDPPMCRTAQFKAYGELFESEEEFNLRYNRAATNDEFMDEIKVRRKAQKALEDLEKLLQENGATLNLSGSAGKKESTVAGKVNKYERELKETFYYDKGIALIFKYCPILVEEFKINKLYFVSREEFYETYISKDYNKFLKSRKKV